MLGLRGRHTPELLRERPANATALRPRLVPRGGDPGLVRIGMNEGWRDLYHQALVMPWWRFMLLAATIYLSANVVFALLYMADPGGVEKARPGYFSDAFFFSIQTMATIGYGVLYPNDLYTNLLVTAETIAALLVIALLTGLIFSRFSRPTARVRFSHHAVVTTFNGVPSLQIRVGNARRNQILDANVSLALVRNVRTMEGASMRRFHDLTLSRAHTPILALTFTAMHPIDETSALAGATRETLIAEQAELLIAVTGLDETMSQVIHARCSFLPEEVLFGARFVDMFGYMPDGRVAIDFRLFDRTTPDSPARC